MASRRNLALGESWVVEEEDYSTESSPREEQPHSSTKHTPPTRGNRSSKSPKSPDPEFVMPPLSNSLDGSRTDPRSNTRLRSVHKTSERMPREQRSTRDTSKSASPEKRSKPKSRTRYEKQPQPRHAPSHSKSNNPPENFLDIVIDHTTGMLAWMFDILSGALRILKTPISYLVAIWLLFGLGLMVRNLITSSVYASLSPICRIPGSSFLNLPFCENVESQHKQPQHVEFDKLVAVQSNFEQVLEESAGGASLPLDMKRGEASIRDLRQLVRYSHLQSKDELVLEFDGFVETARIASYDLQKFNSHVGRAVDNVISTTRWTSRVLDGIQQQYSSRGAIAGFINDNLLAPFQPQKFTEGVLLDQYIKHAEKVEEEIYRLIEEAQALLMILNNLEDRLDVIHGIATREDVNAKASKEETLSGLWAMLGGHRNKINKVDRQIGLLQQVTSYRRKAYAHVSGTILRLQAMGASLEDLRERVGSPELLRDRVDIPLSVHLETIQRGVERLEEQRHSVRRLENHHMRETLDRVQEEERTIDA